MNNDILNMLWDSTDELHRRFDKFPPKSAETLRVFQEEVREFEEEVQFAGTPSGSVTNVCREAADVLVTVFATLSALGITRESFAASAQFVALKNDAKTHDTHFINPDTGKITRRKED